MSSLQVPYSIIRLLTLASIDESEVRRPEDRPAEIHTAEIRPAEVRCEREGKKGFLEGDSVLLRALRRSAAKL
jgi:hypothetical protein